MLRRVHAWAFAAIFFASTAAAQMAPGVSNPVLIGGASAAKAISFQTSSSSTSNGTIYTFNSQALGAPQSDRYVALCAYGNGTNASSATATLDYGAGATAMNLVAESTNGTADTAMFVLNAPTGATGTFVVTFSATKARAGIGVWSVTGLTSDTPVGSATSTANPSTSGSMTTVVGGVMIGCSSVSSSAVTWTWAGGGSENFDFVVESAASYTGASGSTLGTSTTYTATPTGGGTLAGAFGSW